MKEALAMKRRAVAFAAAALMCILAAGCAKTSEQGAFSVLSVQESEQQVSLDNLAAEDWEKLN